MNKLRFIRWKMNAAALSCRLQNLHDGQAVLQEPVCFFPVFFCENPVKFQHLIYHPVSAPVLGKGSGLSVYADRQLRHLARDAVDLDVAFFALDNSITRAVGILGSRENRVKIRIFQDCRSGSIDAVKTDPRILMNAFRHAEKTCCKMKVVDIDIHERTAGSRRIKGRKDLSRKILIITAGILGKIGLDHRDFPEVF